MKIHSFSVLVAMMTLQASAASAADLYVAAGDLWWESVVESAQPGDVVHFEAGTFAQGSAGSSVPVEVAADVTLRGAGPGMTSLALTTRTLASAGSLRFEDISLTGSKFPEAPDITLYRSEVSDGIAAWDTKLTLVESRVGETSVLHLIAWDSELRSLTAPTVELHDSRVVRGTLTGGKVTLRGAYLESVHLFAPSGQNFYGGNLQAVTSMDVRNSVIVDSLIDSYGGDVMLIHNTIVRPRSRTVAVSAKQPPAIMCQGYPGQVRLEDGQVRMYANAVWGYEQPIDRRERCILDVRNNAFFSGGGATLLAPAGYVATWSTNLLNVPFFVDQTTFEPNSYQSPLVGAALPPSDPTDLERDFHGALRTWPATIGAVERRPNQLVRPIVICPAGKCAVKSAAF